MRRLITLASLLLMGGLLAACGANSEPPPDPIPLLETAAQNIHDAESFKIEVWREGAPYFIESDVIDGNLLFDRATMGYVSPDTLQGSVRAKLGSLPFTLNILARGDLQWVQLPGVMWTDELYFAPGFNPQDLIAEDTGFRAALSALIDIEMLGQETLDSGIAVWHMNGMADGAAVTDLLVGLIEAEGEVIIDAYISVRDTTPARLVITMPGTETEDVPEPTQWIVEVYDYNEPVEITGPEA